MRRASLVAILLWAAAIAFSLYWIARHLVITADLSAFLPAAATPSQALVVGQLREGVASRSIIIGIEDGDPPALAAASEALVRELAADARFASVANGNPARFDRERALVHRWRYLLSPGVSEQRFSAAGLKEALDEGLRMLASPLAPAVRPLLGSDPTGESLRMAASMTGSAPLLRHGVWFSDDGRTALLTAFTRAPGFDPDAQEAAAEAIRQAFARAAGPPLRLTMSSPGLLAAESRRAIEQDARVASSLTLAGVVLLLLATYRSVWPTLFSAVPALSGLVVGVVLVSLLLGPVHAITLGFGAMLIGEAIDYPTYLFANNAPGETLASTRARIGPTLLLAVATTSCGALAMLLSGFRGLAQLGALIIAGVVIAGLCTRYLLPAITPARAMAHKRARAPVQADRMFSAMRRWRWPALAAVAVALGVLVASRDALWEDDLASLNPVSPATKAHDRTLRTQARAPDVRYLVVASGRDREQALAASERLASVLDRGVAERRIGGYDYAARYLPSEALQRRRQAALPQPNALGAALDAAVAESPFRSDAFTTFAADIERSRTGPLLRREDLDDTALALRVDSLLVRADEGWAALMPLSAVADAGAIRQAIDDANVEGVAFLDLKAEADALVAGYRAQSIRSTAIGLACMVGVLLVGTRSLRVALRLLAPVLAAVVLTSATLVGGGQRLTVFHLVALLLIVGVGLNYALFFGRDSGSAAERELTLLSVMVAGAATLCASLALAFASTPVLRAIGTTTALGAVFAFLLCAVLAKERT